MLKPFASLAIVLLSSAALAAPPLDAATRVQVVDSLAKQLNDYYVDPDAAAQMGVVLHAKLAHGDYDAIDDTKAFAAVLTGDLRAASHDLHLRVVTGDTPPPEMLAGKPTAAQQEGMQKRMAENGYGIAKVETMAGNIGYLDMRGFLPVQYSAPAITAAMAKLAGTSALIIDMRKNGGGDPAGVAFLSSYLFEQRTHLNDLHWREGDKTVEFWTDVSVPGPRYGEKKPVYVLTSPRTFSGGEEFSYDMQQLKRATLVGETTGGGANPGRMRLLAPNFGAFIPNGRAINPISKTSWEGTGVVPEVKVAADDALDTAHRLALAALKPAPAPL